MQENESRVHHPIFARVYERVSVRAERRFAEHRARTLAGLAGRVVEIGAGNGLNFPHYPAEVTEVAATEPEPHLRELAAEAAREAPIPIRVTEDPAERLSFDAASFDAAVASLVLCTVRDPDRALSELYRVIRPGGELRFHEHVISGRPAYAGLMRVADATLWPFFAGGCHMARDTAAAIERAGFVIASCNRFTERMTAFDPPKPHIVGVARRP
ncbi:MAG: class I SAM-dependent methyltransferase [Gaiellaceae bacterium]